MKSFSLLFYTFCCLVLIYSNQTIAQSDSASLNYQFNTLIENSESYRHYKMIPKTTLEEFWNVVTDSINVSEMQLDQERQQIATLDNQINQLKTTINEKEDALAQSTEQMTHISVLGISFSKTTYALLSVLLYLVLLVLIALLYAKLKTDQKATKNAQKEYARIDNEYQTHKKKSLDKQMKLKRELQTERNKIAELT